MPDVNLSNEIKTKSSYKPTQKEKDLRLWVYNRFDSMAQSSQRHRAERIWRAGEVAWDAIRYERDADDWNSNYYVPMTGAVVESIMAEMLEQSLVPQVLARGGEDKPKARVMQNIFEYTLETANHNDEMENVYRGGLIHGTTFAQEYYLRDRRKVKDIMGLKEAKTKNNRKRKEFVGEEREVLEYDDVIMEWISPWEVYADEKAREINRGTRKCRDIIRHQVMNYRDAKQFFMGDPIWDHLNNFRFVQPGRTSRFNNEDLSFNRPNVFNRFIDNGVNDASEDVDIFWYWSRTPDDLLVVLINDVVVRMGPNIFRHKQLPILKGTDVKRLGSFYGKGEPELLESVQDEVNTLRRMVIDRNHLDIDKMFITSPDMPIDEDDLVARPHGAIPGKPSDVQPIEYGDIPLSIDRTMNSINEDKISITGVDDRFQSVQKTPSTATEAAILKESTLKRIKMKLRSYENGFLVDMGRQRLSNIIQFYSVPKMEKIVGQQGTSDFKKEVAELGRKGLLEIQGGKPFRKRFRQIRMEGKELFPDERGIIQQRKKPGFSFFDISPEFFVPSSPGGFDIRFSAGPSLPVSKPLLQQKISEMYDRLLPIAQEGITNYDPEKIADALVKANELNPEDLKREGAVEEQAVEQNRTELAIELASQENQMLIDGKPIPELGTPFAPPAHTLIHIEFLSSEAVEPNSPEFNALIVHMKGEIAAQDQRGSGQVQQNAGQPQEALPGNPNGIGQGNQNTLPAIVEGGNQVPSGRVLGNG